MTDDLKETNPLASQLCREEFHSKLAHPRVRRAHTQAGGKGQKSDYHGKVYNKCRV